MDHGWTTNAFDLHNNWLNLTTWGVYKADFGYLGLKFFGPQRDVVLKCNFLFLRNYDVILTSSIYSFAYNS